MRGAVIATLLAASLGCQTRWRPPLASDHFATARLSVDLGRRQVPAGATLIYERGSHKDTAYPAEPFTVRLYETGRAEGAVAGLLASPATHLGQAHAGDVDCLSMIDSAPATGAQCRFAVVFDDPLMTLPRVIAGERPVTRRTRFTAHGPGEEGPHRGTVTRKVKLDGYDAVTVAEHEYTDCVRLRIETRYHVPWKVRVNSIQYVWLAPGVGPVRRLERWRGSVGFRFFDEIDDYRLVRIEPAEKAAIRRPIEEWTCCVVDVAAERTAPRLRGFVARFATDAASGAVVAP